MFYHWSRDFWQMQTYAQKLLAVTQEYEYEMYGWLGQLYTTAASSALGDMNAGHGLLRQNIDAIIARGTRMHVPYTLCLLAEVCTREGQAAEGNAALNEALAMSMQTGEQLWEAETHRLRGDLLVAQGLGREAGRIPTGVGRARGQQASAGVARL
jgi:predicted ATPase